MPSLESVKKFRESMFSESMSLIDKKGADYNRKQQLQGDTLFNLRVCALLGIVPSAPIGILVRLSDKFMRLISLMGSKEGPQVKGESVRDTVRDIHNYIDYALQLWEEEQINQAKQAVPITIGGGVLRGAVMTGGHPDVSGPVPPDTISWEEQLRRENEAAKERQVILKRGPGPYPNNEY